MDGGTGRVARRLPTLMFPLHPGLKRVNLREMATHQVQELFASGLRFLYGAHQQAAKQTATNVQTSSDPALRKALEAGTKGNDRQARRLLKVFKAAGLVPSAMSDTTMQGIIHANNDAIGRSNDPDWRDLTNIAYGQVAAHFYMAQYGTLRTYAQVLKYKKAARLLQQTLEETKAIDLKLTVLGRKKLRAAAKGERVAPKSGSGVAAAAILAAGAAGLISLALKNIESKAE